MDKVKQELKPNQNNESVIVKKKLRENKFFFYGFPLAVVISVFVGLLFFILPAVQYFFESRKLAQILDKNSTTVNNSIKNLKTAYTEEPQIREYDTKITEYIPKEHKLGSIINLIQKKASDFSLENQVQVGTSPDQTSLDTLVKKDENDKAIFESISSGEIYFEPKSLDKSVNAYLLSIQVNVNGERTAFFDFLKDLDKEKPLINVVSVEYTESDVENDKTNVAAVLRLESYALNMDLNGTVSQSQPVRYEKDDKRLLSSIASETFVWDKGIINNLDLNSKSSSNSESLKTLDSDKYTFYYPASYTKSNNFSKGIESFQYLSSESGNDKYGSIEYIKMNGDNITSLDEAACKALFSGENIGNITLVNSSECKVKILQSIQNWEKVYRIIFKNKEIHFVGIYFSNTNSSLSNLLNKALDQFIVK